MQLDSPAEIWMRLARELGELLAHIESLGIDIDEVVEDATELEMYVTDTRYPDDLIEPGKPELEDALRLAEAVLHWAEKHAVN